MSSTIQREFPLLKGKNIDALPEDLFIPPNALELILEEFSGPMDLLLYLINKKDIDILELDVASITEQYLQYIEIMEELKVELASDYMVMAATLAHIKSRMLLPQDNELEDEEDPRSTLIKRLQEYKRFKSVSERISNLPKIERDYFVANAGLPKFNEPKEQLPFNTTDLRDVFAEVISRPKFEGIHFVEFEELTTQERIEHILGLLTKRNIIQFFKTFKKSEGRQGVAVALLASLELVKDGNIEIIQNEDSNQLYLKSVSQGVH